MAVWSFIIDNLENDIAVTLLYVLDSKGSSPGRKGFVMAVNEQGIFEGTIGGGIMEVKMIELAKSKIKKEDNQPIVREQFHDKSHNKNQSGLICSGSQTVACIPLGKKDSGVIKTIIKRKKEIFLVINSVEGLIICTNHEEVINIKTANDFKCIVKINPQKTIHIFGSGHVGIALARQMSILGYKVIQYDDRPNLISHSTNQFADIIKVIDYDNLKMEMEAHSSDVVVIVSFSYRSDKIILKQLYDQPFAYIGMMGSDHKIATLKEELESEGISEEDLKSIFAPIGLNMYSKTAEEIAVSIAGQIILETNRNLPTGRKYGCISD